MVLVKTILYILLYIFRINAIYSYIYFVSKECGGLLTTPGEIKPLMNGNQYFGRLDCTWKIQAPSDKSVVLRFESFDIEFNFK